MKLLRDLFGPKHQHSDPAIRLAAVPDLDPTEHATVLEQLAGADDDPRVRLAAAQRVQAPAAWHRLRALAQPAEVQRLLASRLNEHHQREAIAAADLAAAQPALAALQGDASLAAVVAEAKPLEVRLAALARITDEDELCKLAERGGKDGGLPKEVGLAIVTRLQVEANLERVAARATAKGVRRAAEERVAAARAARAPAPDRKAEREQELLGLLTSAQQWAESYQWDFMLARFAQADQRWLELDPQESLAARHAFVAAHEKLKSRQQAYLARQAEEQRVAAERAAAQQRREAATKGREALLTQAEQLGADLQPATCATQIAALRTAWAALPPCEGDDAATESATFDKRFANVTTAVEQALRRHQADAEALARLTALVQEAETLRSAADLPAAAQRAGELRADARRVRFHGPPHPEMIAKLEEIALALRQAVEAKFAAQAKEALGARETLITQMTELVARAGEPESERQVRELAEAWKQLPAWADKAAGACQQRFKEAVDHYYEARRAWHKEKDIEYWANLTAKEELVREMNALDTREDLPAVAKEIKEAQAKWKAIGAVPKDRSAAVWQEFKTATDRNYARCKVLFDQMEADREGNYQKRLELIERAESLMNSTDWEAAATEIKQAQADWHELGAVPRERDKESFDRFQAACHTFFDRRRRHYQEKEIQREDHAAAKQRLVAEAETLAGSQDYRHAEALRRLQEEWKKVGPAKREREEELWGQFRSACDRFFSWLEAQRPENLAKKQALVTQLEALLAEKAEAARDHELARQITALQQEWRAIGPGPRAEEQVAWERFHHLCDGFFTARREINEKFKAERVANQQLKETVVAQAEALAAGDPNAEAADAMKALQQQWRTIGPAPREVDETLWTRFQAAGNQLFGARRARYQEREAEWSGNLQAKEALCAQLEHLLGPEAGAPPPAENKPPKPAKHLDLAQELKLAMEANFAMDRGQGQQQRPAADRQADISQEVRRIQAKWKDIGPVPGDRDRPLWQRYRRAMDRYYGKSRGDAPRGPSSAPRRDAPPAPPVEAAAPVAEVAAAETAPAVAPETIVAPAVPEAAVPEVVVEAPAPVVVEPAPVAETAPIAPEAAEAAPVAPAAPPAHWETGDAPPAAPSAPATP